MIFQEVSFQYFSVWDFIESGLYFMIVGFFLLLSFYFLFVRYRTSKKLYWLFFSLFFVCLCIGRIFFIIYYDYAPELYDGSTNGAAVVDFLMINYRMATFFTWMGTACAVGVLGILLFPPDLDIETKVEQSEATKKGFENKENIKILIRIVLFVIPVIIGILALTLPNELFMDPNFVEEYTLTISLKTITIGSWTYPLGRFILNFIFQPLFLALIPVIFIYLAWKTFGVLRKSYALNAIGLLLYYTARILHGALIVADFPHFRATVPPLIILLALVILVIANNYEQLK